MNSVFLCYKQDEKQQHSCPEVSEPSCISSHYLQLFLPLPSAPTVKLSVGLTQGGSEKCSRQGSDSTDGMNPIYARQEKRT